MVAFGDCKRSSQVGLGQPPSLRPSLGFPLKTTRSWLFQQFCPARKAFDGKRTAAKKGRGVRKRSDHRTNMGEKWGVRFFELNTPHPVTRRFEQFPWVAASNLL